MHCVLFCERWHFDKLTAGTTRYRRVHDAPASSSAQVDRIFNDMQVLTAVRKPGPLRIREMLNINVSLGSEATRLRCGGIFNDDYKFATESYRGRISTGILCVWQTAAVVRYCTT